MADFSWPELSSARHLGRRASRLDGPVKSTGRAEYATDKAPEGMLHALLLTCPHAHAVITRLDTSAAESMPGVRAIHVIQGRLLTTP